MKPKNALYNADCLPLLERLPTAQVTLAYLDPPWPTLDEPIEEYILFLVERLVHIHRILSEQGSLLIHLPPEISSYVRILLNRIFGRKNFRNQFVMPYSLRPFHNLRHYINYSSIILYSKSDDFIYNPPGRSRTKEEIERFFPKQDDRGRYRLESLFSFQRGDRPTMRFEWQGIMPPPGRWWRYRQDHLNQLFKEGLIDFTSNKLPSLKRYYNPTDKVNFGSIWDDIPRILDQAEKTEFFAQQSLKLLARIIDMSTNEGDLVIDPFCGSGTTLVAAQESKRKWIGCDKSLEAFRIAQRRLTKKFSLTPGNDFEVGDRRAIENNLPIRFTSDLSESLLDLISQLIESSDKPTVDYSSHNQIVRPLIITEGKTDWMHLKAAYTRLREAGLLSEEFEIDFLEYKEALGGSELLSTCRTYSRVQRTSPHICIFDSDNLSIVREVTNDGDYKCWKNRVFSFVLPVPSHRENNPNLSIELYYRDEDIKTLDPNGRRLFLNDEFNQESGRHTSENLNWKNPKKSPGVVKIVDCDVYDSRNQNVALPKSDFADYVLNAAEGFGNFDVNEFLKIFDVISRILDMVRTES